MDVVWEKGLKNINIPINTGTLRFKILNIFSLVLCSLNCGDVSLIVSILILFVKIFLYSPFKKVGVLDLFLKTTDHKAG